jgi:hypothetical protein
MADSPRWRRWLEPDSRSRRLLVAFAIYATCAITFAIVAGPLRLREHTQFNHYAHLANAWLNGRQDLPNGPPPYAAGNDFAQHGGKTFISFPPFPALLMLPFVALAGSPENFRDGQFVVWLAGVAPAALFLLLEKLRRTGRSVRTELENAVLALLFAFGSVYFFTAVEGTVWFAALVVGAALVSFYALFALDAERPLLAGTMMAFAFATRPPILLAAPFFALEAVRVCTKDGVSSRGTFLERARAIWQRINKRRLFRSYALFAAPIALGLLVESWMNLQRFGKFDPSVGHEFLTVAWAGRIQKWGLFGYHYFAKNLGIMMAELPWLPAKGAPAAWACSAPAPFQINEHGLALWFTTPIFLWLFRPRTRGWLYDITLVALAGPILMDLLYQNSGWRTFGYRFSNDYSPLLFVLLALGNRPMNSPWFRVAALWSVAWNLFGAVTFDRGDRCFERFYFREGTQAVVYQPD